MRKLFAVAALSLALTSFTAVPSFAQADLRAAAVAACSTGSADACQAAIAAFVAAVENLPGPQKDAQLAAFVVALSTTAQGANPVAADAIRAVAAEFTNASQAAAAIEVAAAVDTGTQPPAGSVQTLGSAA